MDAGSPAGAFGTSATASNPWAPSQDLASIYAGSPYNPFTAAQGASFNLQAGFGDMGAMNPFTGSPFGSGFLGGVRGDAISGGFSGGIGGPLTNGGTSFPSPEQDAAYQAQQDAKKNDSIWRPLTNALNGVLPGIESRLDFLAKSPLDAVLATLEYVGGVQGGSANALGGIGRINTPAAGAGTGSGIVELGSGINSRVWTAGDGFVNKEVKAGETVATVLADFTNDAHSIFPTLVPSVTREGATLRQPLVDGQKFSDLGLAAQETAERAMRETIGQAHNDLGMKWVGERLVHQEAPQLGNGLYVQIDTNPANFRFNADGTIKSWFDPIAVHSTDPFAEVNQLFGVGQ